VIRTELVTRSGKAVTLSHSADIAKTPGSQVRVWSGQTKSIDFERFTSALNSRW
jgi:hypothetical protein